MESLSFRLKNDHQNDTPYSSPSPEMFSFPGTPNTEDDPESEFEFGSCVISTPGSLAAPTPTQAVSPADQFFLNGRLLPHSFAPPTHSGPRASFSGRDNNNNNININNLSRGTSIGSSSISSSKDLSLLSSRSNSTNSHGGEQAGGGSTCTSARTSSSEVSERRVLQKRIKTKGSSFRDQRNATVGNHNHCSQRWQFITGAPVLAPSRSRGSGVGPASSPRKKKKREEREVGNNKENNNEGFLQRILRTFLERCMACHAMEGPEKEFHLDNDSVLAS